MLGTATEAIDPGVLGWREAGLGDPLTDLAVPLGELLEMGVLGGPHTDVLRGAAYSLLDGYVEGRRRQLSGTEQRALASYVARSVLDHAQLRLWTSGTGVALPKVLGTVERELALLLCLGPAA